MKKTFTVMVKDKDGKITPKGVLAQDLAGNKRPSLPDPCPACLVAHIAALTAGGDGAETVNLNFGSTVDIDTTA